MKKYFWSVCLGVFFSFLVHAQKQSSSLKQAYSPYFKIGTALNSSHIQEGDYDGMLLVRKHFNAITPENVMKWEVIHPSPNQYNFALPDAFVKLGQKDSMFIVGHTLVWHSQLPIWVQSITDPVELEKVMKDHIFEVVGKYKGHIHAWDVVNEALNEDGSMRESVFYKVLGPDYIAKAFKYAHEADPNCKLYYNDYNMVVPAKRQGAIRIIKELQAQGIPIHGVGMQGHWNLQWPSLQNIEQAITDFAALGIAVMITELDITVLPNPWDLVGADVNQQFENSDFMNPYPNFLPDSVDILLAKRYEDIFNIFITHQTSIERVSFWGVNDGVSWLNDWPIRGRTNYPLLFNRNFKPKRAYKSVMGVVK